MIFRDVADAVVDGQLHRLRLAGNDIQGSDVGGVGGTADHKDGGRRLIQLDAVGLAGCPQGGNDIAAFSIGNCLVLIQRIAIGIILTQRIRALVLSVVGADVDEGQVGGIEGALDLEAVGTNSLGAHLNSNIAGRILLGNGRYRAHLGVQLQALGDCGICLHGLGHGSVVVPAQKQTVLHGGCGQMLDPGALTVGFILGQGHSSDDFRGQPVHQAELHQIGSGRVASTGLVVIVKIVEPVIGAGFFRLLLTGLDLLTRGGIDAHALGLHAGLAVPGFHRMVHAGAQGHSFGAGGIIDGIEVGSITVEDPLAPQRQDRVLCPVGHLVHVGGLGGHGVFAVFHVKGFTVAHKEGGQLLAVDQHIGRILICAGALGDAVLHGPCNVRGIILADIHVVKGTLAHVCRRIHTGHTAQNGDKHAAGHATLRVKFGVGNTFDQTVGVGIHNCVMIPRSILHVGKGCFYIWFLLCCQRRDGQQRQQHTKHQQKAYQSFFHSNTHPPLGLLSSLKDVPVDLVPFLQKAKVKALAEQTQPVHSPKEQAAGIAGSLFSFFLKYQAADASWRQILLR